MEAVFMVKYQQHEIFLLLHHAELLCGVVTKQCLCFSI